MNCSSTIHLKRTDKILSEMILYEGNLKPWDEMSWYRSFMRL